MADTTKTMTEYLDGLTENTSPTTDNVSLTKEPGQNPKKTKHIAAPEWADDITYSQNQIVNYGGIVYKSLQNSNLNKQPDTETAWWQNIDTKNTSIPTWDSSLTYALSDIINYSGKLYVSLQNSNLNKNPATETAWWKVLNTGGSTQPDLFFAAGSTDYPSSNPARLNTRVLTNGNVKEHLHNDTTNEAVTGQYRVPSDLDNTGDITWYWIGSPVTAAASNVVLAMRYSQANDTEDADVAFTTSASAAETMSATQDAVNIVSWTTAASSLTPGEFMRWIFLRDAAGTYQAGDTLSGDLGTWYLIGIFPRS